MSKYMLNCWCIGDDQNSVCTIEIQPTNTVSQLKSLIADCLRWDSGIVATAALIWKVAIPEDDINSYVSGTDWQSLSSTDCLAPVRPLEDVIPMPPIKNFLHIVIQRPKQVRVSAGIKRNREDEDEDEDEVGDTIMDQLQKRFKQTVKKILTGPPPSEAAKSTSYRVYQDSFPIYDGRYAINSPTSTIGPPVQLFHPVFAAFLDDVANVHLDVPQSVLEATSRFMVKASALYPLERQRKIAINTDLSNAISSGCTQIVNLDMASSDCIVLTTVGAPINEVAALLLREDKRELGEGGCDPTIQAGLSVARFWSQSDHDIIRENTCCPTFLLANGGPWLVILGTVFTDKVLCQPLTNIFRISVDRVLNEGHISHIARVLHALGRNIVKLKEYYDGLPAASSPLNLGRHTRYFPSIDSYFDTMQQAQVSFDYIQPLETDPTCVTYLAQTKSLKYIVVKFVERYGEDVHRLLAENDLAPQLLYFGQIDRRPGAPSYNSLRMVVMEYLEGATVTQLQGNKSLDQSLSNKSLNISDKNLTTALEKIMELLHRHGFVYGDLRRPNVMVMPGGKVKLIDFDWAGKAGTAKYPLLLSPGVNWPVGVTGGALITVKHDLDMIQHVRDLAMTVPVNFQFGTTLMSTFDFGFDSTALQVNNSNIPTPGFHPPSSSSNLGFNATSASLGYSSHTGINGGFQASGSAPNMGLNMTTNNFQVPSSSSNLGGLNVQYPIGPLQADNSSASSGSAASFEGHSLAELLRNPQAFEMYRSWKENSTVMSQTVSNLVKQNGDLQQQNTSLQHHICTQTSEINALKVELQLLQKQNAHDSNTFTSGPRSASITPHDSVSQVTAGLSTKSPYQPAIRPEQYPESILWSLKDAQDAQLVTESNKSRPPMEKCIRNEDGSQIGVAQWRAIKLTARTIVQTELLSLPISNLAKVTPRTKVYYKQYHLKAWLNAVYELERRQPLLFLCEGNWKADHVLGATLLASVSEAKQKLKRQWTGTDADDIDEEATRDFTAKKNDMGDIRDDKNSWNAEGSQDEATGLSKKRPKLSTSPSPVPKKKKKNLKTRSQIAKTPQAPTPLQDQLSSLSGSRPVMVAPVASPTPTNTVPQDLAPGNGQTDRIDISFIHVESSCSSLKEAFSEGFPSIPFAQDLLDAMKTQPDLETGPASESVTAFLSRIDNADPNSSEYSEDDSNSCWGHSQFCSGGLSCSSVLTSWHDVGSVKMACKLIAAAIKTCKVARHICSYRDIDPGSYLSDAYLQNIVEKLWDLWKAERGDKPPESEVPKTAFRVIDGMHAISNSSEPSAPAQSQPLSPIVADRSVPPAAPAATNESMLLEDTQTPRGSDLSQLRSALQGLQREELKQWLIMHKVVVPPKSKQRTKDDIISTILDFSSTKPSIDEIKSILDARKKRSGTKSTVSAASAAES